MPTLSEIIEKPTRRVVGLMSGTSMDGVDAAMVLIEGSGSRTKLQVEATYFEPYSEEIRGRILELTNPETSGVDKVCHLNFLLGEIFAEAALGVAKKGKVALTEIDLIGSHGQTIYHIPSPQEEGKFHIRSTLQIGEPAVIAERTGICTVADFRPRDMAAGGEGAPLVPYADYILFHSDTEDRVILNIGGIANVTFLPSSTHFKGTIGFDTGPGNMVLDALAKLFLGGNYRFDEVLAEAKRGTVSQELLETCLSMPYFSRKPPKSTGRELFGEAFVYYFLKEGEKRKLPHPALLATICALTSSTIAKGVRDYFPRPLEGAELIASGGGAKNTEFMRLLETYLPMRIRRSDEYGIPSDFKEAIAFAILANDVISGLPTNVPSVTGARHPVPLGKIIPPAVA